MATSSIRRLAGPAAAVLGLLLAAALVSSWLIDRNAVRQAVETQIHDATGLDVTVDGDVDVSVFPSAHVTLRRVSLKGSGDYPPLSAPELRADLSLLPLLTGHYRVTDLSLTSPRITVAWDENRQSNWARIVDTFAEAMKPGADRGVWVSAITVTDGTLIYSSDRAADAISDIDLKFSLPSSSRAFSATGQASWHNVRLDGNFNIADFIAAVAGDKSGLTVSLTGSPLTLAFDGTMSNKSSLLLEGAVTANGSSLRDAMRWIGRELPGDNGFGPFSLKARANAVGNSVALTNVRSSLDGNAAEGVLTFNGVTGQQALQGTLAADTLDLTPYVGTVRLLANGARYWNRQAFDFSALSETNLDIRLSAAKVSIGSSRFGRMALGANLRGGTLALSVGEAQAFGGIARGSLSIGRAGDAPNLKAQFGFTDVDLEAGTNEFFGTRALRGRGDLSVTLEASGASPFALTQSLDGSATLTGHDGAIAGLNLEQLLKRLERRPLSGGGEFRSGATPFNTLKIALTINDGMANADTIELDGPTTHVALTGTVSIPSREYDLKGTAELKTADGSPPSFQLPFVVQGPWDSPLIFPDSDILIRRSTVTRPLLDSLKDHKTRETVKAVIDRLSGVKKPSADAAPADAAPAAPSAQPN